MTWRALTCQALSRVVKSETQEKEESVAAWEAGAYTRSRQS